MRFTSMFRYGLRAMSVLSDNYGKGPISAKEISACEDISPSFLEQLLAQLRRSGLIRGIRGPGGGFELTRHPSRIKLIEIVEALEGPILVSRCLGPSKTRSRKVCDRFDDCPAVPLYKRLERDFAQILGGYRLNDLGKKRRTAKRRAGGRPKRRGGA